MMQGEKNAPAEKLRHSTKPRTRRRKGSGFLCVLFPIFMKL